MYESTRRAIAKYHRDKLIRVTIIFRKDFDDDMRALMHLRRQRSHSAYVREVILSDMHQMDRKTKNNEEENEEAAC